MSTKRAATLRLISSEDIRRWLRPVWTPNPNDPAVASTALAVTVALLRALRDRGLLSEGEIDDLFGEAAERLRDTSAQNLLSRVRADVEHKDEE